jgi:hypothetical protein
MFTGLAVLGLLAGNLASSLRLEPEAARPSAETETTAEQADVAGRLDALHADVSRLTALVERLVPLRSEPPNDR